MYPQIQKNGSGWVVILDTNSAVWYWHGKGFGVPGCTRHEPKIFDSESKAQRAIKNAVAHIRKHKPGWSALLDAAKANSD